MPGDDQAAVRVDRRDVGGVDAPQRVAQVLGQAERLAELAGRVDRPAGGGVERGHLEEDPSVGDRHAGEDARAVRDHVARRRSSRPRRARRALRRACCRRSRRRPRRCSRCSVQFAPIVDAAQHDGALDRRVGADGHAGLEHDAAADPGIARRSGSRARPARRGSPGPRSRMPSSTQTKPSPMRARDLGRDGALEDVERALEVALGRADVEPVAVADVAVQALADQAREHVALDRRGLLGRRAGRAPSARARRCRPRCCACRSGPAPASRRSRSPRRRRACARARRRTGPRPASARAWRARRAARAARAARSTSRSVSTSPLSIRKRSSSSDSANFSAPPVPSGCGSST